LILALAPRADAHPVHAECSIFLRARKPPLAQGDDGARLLYWRIVKKIGAVNVLRATFISPP
jgi:hypothetical protein